MPDVEDFHRIAGSRQPVPPECGGGAVARPDEILRALVPRREPAVGHLEPWFPRPLVQQRGPGVPDRGDPERLADLRCADAAAFLGQRRDETCREAGRLRSGHAGTAFDLLTHVEARHG